MKRLSILLMISALVCVMAATVYIASPYAPVVQPVAEIERIWEIEDTREESSVPLVTALENNGVPLMHDAAEDAFYCTLGLNHGDEWPDIHLTAPGAKGVELVFVDDYSYDWCADALFMGYPYQILAYTDTAYQYIQVVFTGLPMVSIESGEEITTLDTEAVVTVSAYGAQPVSSRALVHHRGGGTLDQEKKNFKIDFVRDARGRGNTVDLPGFGLREDIILNGMVFDELLVRDRLSWAVYEAMLGDEADGAFAQRKTAYAELFVGGEYRGVYLMMEPMNAQDELRKAGDAHLMEDSVYRSLIRWFADGERPLELNPCNENSYFEMRYAPSQAQPFAGLQRYLALLTCEDDETFARMAAQSVDMESLVRYVLLRQAGALTDNVHNNMYLWARREQDGVRYAFVPWDLDMTWGKNDQKLGESFENWLAFPLADRILALNAGGAAQMMVDQWRSWRGEIFTTENIEQILMAYSEELSASGAVARNAMRWEISIDDTGGSEIVYFAQMRFEAMDRAMDQVEQMLQGGEVPAFLAADGYAHSSTPIFDANE